MDVEGGCLGVVRVALLIIRTLWGDILSALVILYALRRLGAC